MIRIKGLCRDQKLELEAPVNLPEGTEVVVEIRSRTEVEKAERDAWSELGMSRLEEEWNNPQDAVYDNWRNLYGVDRG